MEKMDCISSSVDEIRCKESRDKIKNLQTDQQPKPLRDWTKRFDNQSAKEAKEEGKFVDDIPNTTRKEDQIAATEKSEMGERIWSELLPRSVDWFWLKIYQNECNQAILIS